MKRISYHVNCKKNKLDLKIKSDKLYIEKAIAEIIYKRREKKCYENSTN